MDSSRQQSSSQSRSPNDDYFNDLAQQPPAPNEQQPKSKRMACVLCRKRKLKCDGAKPACATCVRLSHDCAYDEVRKKSGPKRGYVKALEARLAQVETMLKTQDPIDGNEDLNDAPQTAQMSQTAYSQTMAGAEFGEMEIVGNNEDDILLQSMNWNPDVQAGQPDDSGLNILPEYPPSAAYVDTLTDSWGSLIGLGLEEPLPDQVVIDELHQIYFSKMHLNIPIFHRPRYLMAMANTMPKLRPAVHLQYAVWALAASISDKYETMADHYYKKARYYLEREEMSGTGGENMMSLHTPQTWFLIASYEFKNMYFPRAWMSTGRAARFALMLGLNRVDGMGLDVKQCLTPPKDWIDREERRRTFWMCFCEDRYASIGTGWPMSLDEADILTDLPASDEAFESGTPEPTITLNQALGPEGASVLSPLGGVIVLACLFGRNLLHLHRTTPEDDEGNLNGAFWKRHRSLDNILLNTSLGLPDHLRMPHGVNSSNIVFINMCIHTSTICLHQAAIFKADKNRMSPKVSAESKIRCITAAAEITSIMKLASHQDLSGVNPFTSFCLYVAARVFVQYLKSRPRDEQVKASLHFLLSAMHAVKKKNPLAESFLVQLDVDLEIAGMDELRSIHSRKVRARAANQDIQTDCAVELFTRAEGNPVRAQTEAYKDEVRAGRMPTFGNNGLAAHTAPEPVHKLTRLDFVEMNAPAREFRDRPDRESRGILGYQGVSMAMPSRQKTPSSSLDPSPQTITEEMDFSGSNTNEQSTPSPLQNSSGRASISAYTPPTLQHEDSASMQFVAYDPNKTSNVTVAEMYGKDGTAEWPKDIFMEAPSDTVNLDYSQFIQRPSQTKLETLQKTGFTPGASENELFDLSEAEWTQVLEGMSGWEHPSPRHHTT